MAFRSFLLEDESIVSTQEALSTLGACNDSWQPKYCLTDFAEEEIQAIELAFTGNSPNMEVG